LLSNLRKKLTRPLKSSQLRRRKKATVVSRVVFQNLLNPQPQPDLQLEAQQAQHHQPKLIAQTESATNMKLPRDALMEKTSRNCKTKL